MRLNARFIVEIRSKSGQSFDGEEAFMAHLS